MRLVFFLSLAIFGLTASLVMANQVLYSDTFDQKFSWVSVRNASHSNPTSPCLTPNGVPEWKVVDGVIEILINGSLPCSMEIVPSQSAGQNLRAFRVTLKLFISEPKMDRNLLLRWKDSDNNILFHLFGSGISVEKKLNGKSATVENSTRAYAFQSNRWYDMQMEYDLSLRSLKLFINGQLVIDAKEPEEEAQLEMGKPGLAASVGAVRYSYARFDDFTVESLESGQTLNVELVKQTDERWNSHEYDSAQDWAPTLPTIGRWGCALTSGVMVLRFFGIHNLPDGKTITPATLNDWLNQQSDGYYPGGSINWRALSRLSLWHEQQHGTPALEMTYENPSDKIGWLKRKIQDGTPVILSQPSHFITAYGYGPGQADFAIHDPFYDRTFLSAYKNTYSSARLFTPSHTDLSAITIIVPLSTEVIFTLNGVKQTVQKTLEYPLSARSDLPYVIYDLPKPSGEVVATVSSTIPFQFAWVYAYNAEGDSSIIRKSIYQGSAPQEIIINALEKAPSITFPAISTKPLILKELSALYLSGSIHGAVLIPTILSYQNKLVALNDVQEAEAVERGYRLLLKSAIKNYWLDPATATGLLDHFHQLLLEKFP